jgi:hypothetical protein
MTTKYYNPTGGSNGNSGDSASDAYETLAYAESQTSGGDTIILVTGAHTVSTTLTYAGGRTYIGQKGAVLNLQDLYGINLSLSASNDTVIQNIRFLDARRDGTNVGIIDIVSGSDDGILKLLNNTFITSQNNGGAAFFLDNSRGTLSSKITLSGNTIVVGVEGSQSIYTIGGSTIAQMEAIFNSWYFINTGTLSNLRLYYSVTAATSKYNGFKTALPAGVAPSYLGSTRVGNVYDSDSMTSPTLDTDEKYIKLLASDPSNGNLTLCSNSPAITSGGGKNYEDGDVTVKWFDSNHVDVGGEVRAGTFSDPFKALADVKAGYSDGDTIVIKEGTHILASGFDAALNDASVYFIGQYADRTRQIIQGASTYDIDFTPIKTGHTLSFKNVSFTEFSPSGSTFSIFYHGDGGSAQGTIQLIECDVSLATAATQRYAFSYGFIDVKYCSFFGSWTSMLANATTFGDVIFSSFSDITSIGGTNIDYDYCVFCEATNFNNHTGVTNSYAKTGSTNLTGVGVTLTNSLSADPDNNNLTLCANSPAISDGVSIIADAWVENLTDLETNLSTIEATAGNGGTVGIRSGTYNLTGHLKFNDGDIANLNYVAEPGVVINGGGSWSVTRVDDTSTSNMKFYGISFQNLEVYDIGGTVGGAVNFTGFTTLTFSGCNFINIHGTTSARGCIGSFKSSIDNTTTFNFVSCVFSGYLDADDLVGFFGGYGGTSQSITFNLDLCTVYINKLCANGVDIFKIGGGSNSINVESNCIFSSGNPAVVNNQNQAWNHNLTGVTDDGNPLFADPANGNFTLCSNSPALN